MEGTRTEELVTRQTYEVKYILRAMGNRWDERVTGSEGRLD